MKIQDTWIRFEEKGERITGRKGAIKTNCNGKYFFEIYDVPGEEGTLRINVNDYIVDRLTEMESEYVTLICKDSLRNFVEVRPAQHPSWDTHDSVSDLLESEFDDEQEEYLLMLSDLILFKRNHQRFCDYEMNSMLTQLETYLRNKMEI